MIKEVLVGDITSPANKRHIILGMNTTLDDLVNRISLPYVQQIKSNLTHPLELGSVLSFRFDETRNLHLLVCHNIGFGGWRNADKYIRFGLDYLDHTENNDSDQFSIVQIGTGPVGHRDGAEYQSIHTAIATSYLPLTLFIPDDSIVPEPSKDEALLEVAAYAAWTPDWGRQDLELIA